MSKVLNFLYDWIGPNGPMMNSKVPNIYELMKRMPYTKWDRNWVTDEFDVVALRYRDYVPCRIIPTYDLPSIGNEPFIYEFTMSMKNGYEQGSLQTGTGMFENVPVNPAVINAINAGQGWLVVSNILESFVDDVTISRLHNYFSTHNVRLDRVVYLSNCLNGKEIYENFCKHRNLVPEVIFEYAGIYLLDHINNANRDEFVNRKYDVTTPRKKTFLNFNRRYRPHRFFFLLKMFESNILDQFHISFADKQPGSDPWFNEAQAACRNYNIHMDDDTIRRLEQQLPFTLDSDNLNRFPVEDFVFDPYRFYDESLIHVVSETNFESDAIHITEKTIKPIMFKQPFIIIGPQGSLRYLKEMGFKTFSHIWDESYDSIYNPHQRMSMIVSLINEIAKASPEEKMNIARSAQEVVEYNFEHLKNRKHEEVSEFCNKYGSTVEKI
jgi:hypothetical protein